MLLSHTVLSELYQEKLVTKDDVRRMRGVGGKLSSGIFRDLCTKPPKVVTRAADVLSKHGYNQEARQLRGW